MNLVLGSIPSPPSDRIGPIRAYGLMIALGALVAVEVGRRRYAARGGDPDAIATISIWAIPAGLVGARLYHVATDWNRLYSDGRWSDAFQIWNGGLGIPGGLALGILVGALVARRTTPDWRVAADAMVPGFPLGQAIGRLGNWFNQELFGGPTELPWGLEIDPEHRPLEHLDRATYHPTFLYEMVWNLGLFGLLIWVDRRFRLKPGRLLPLYVVGYFLGRLWVEAIRIDAATTISGLRVNTWLSLVMIVVGTYFFLRSGGPLRSDELDGDGDGGAEVLGTAAGPTAPAGLGVPGDNGPDAFAADDDAADVIAVDVGGADEAPKATGEPDVDGASGHDDGADRSGAEADAGVPAAAEERGGLAGRRRRRREVDRGSGAG